MKESARLQGLVKVPGRVGGNPGKKIGQPFQLRLAGTGRLFRELSGQDYVDTYATKPAAASESVETLETTVSPEMPERRSSASVLSAAAI